MTIFRCKMCGGDLEVVEGSSICTCDFCGTKQTVPTVKDEGLQTLFNRANVLRMKSEFDKAAEVYEKILLRSESEAEAYWGLILCKYGIEYVEDPVTFRRIPTCHRTSYDAVITDEDYKNALRYADPVQREIYESEAKAIDEIQKGIIALARKEEAYDVFICYKETDDSGKRTQDSVIANDIYHQLTMDGFKVFYAAISLEDKLGTEYEPYIFSALNTAKVMLAIGTRPEYFNAVWVKNEWSRFLKLMKKDRTRLLIPCYRDMDPYELPEEFAHLQAQDMSKIGFINDLVRGIKKVIVKNPVKPATKDPIIVQNTGKTTAAAQIKRGNMALEDHDWNKADGFFEEALNLDPECAEGYIGKLLAKEKLSKLEYWFARQKKKYSVSTTERLQACPEESAHIEQKVQEYKLEGYLDAETIRKEYVFDRGYNSALSSRKRQKESQEAELLSDRMLSRARQYAEGETKKRIEEGLADITGVLEERIVQSKKKDLESIDNVKKAYEAHIAQADKKAEVLNRKASEKREQEYQDAVKYAGSAKDLSDYEKARDILLTFKGYKDSFQLAEKCQKEIEHLKEEQRQEEERQEAIRKKEAERAAKKRKKMAAIFGVAAIVCIAVVLCVTKVIIPNSNYNKAVALMEQGDYEAAIESFTALEGYKDSKEKLAECQKEIDYTVATDLMEKGDYEAAIESFTALEDYKDSKEKVEECNTNIIKNTSVGSVIKFGSYEQDNNPDNGKEEIEWIVLEKKDKKYLVISKYGLDCKPYNAMYVSITWESCSLRKWLNETFVESAFDSDQKVKILTTTVTADKNPNYNTDSGKETKDKVFLLSIDEANKYFTDDESRMCVPTSYAEAQGVLTSDEYSVGGKPSCWWWLRSPGNHGSNAANVAAGGLVIDYGNHVYYDNLCVRPALWINPGS